MLLLRTVALLLLLGVLKCPGQSPDGFIAKLHDARSEEAFNRRFDSMISVYHLGKLDFTKEDVEKIVTIANAKPFADKLYAKIYPWVNAMFGDGRIEEAIIYFLENAENFKREGKELGESICYFEVALIQHKAANYEDAKQYYLAAMEAGGNRLPYRTRINCINGLGLISRENRNFDSAIVQFKEALQIAANHLDTAWLGILAGNIGSCHFQKEDYDSSLYYYRENLYFIRRTPEFENEIETYTRLGHVYLKLNRYKLSKKYLDSAVQIIEDRNIKFNDFFNPLDYIHETYAGLYAELSDYEKAYEHHILSDQYRTQRQKSINGRRLKQLQSVYSFTQKQKEVELLKSVNDANLLVIRQQRYIGWSLGIILVLLGGVIYVLLKNSRYRKRMNRKLRESNRELVRINSVKDKLFSVISHDLRTPVDNLRSLVFLMKSNSITTDELTVFAERLSMQLEVSGRTLENLLHWAKAQLNQIKATPTNVNLQTIVNLVITQLANDLSRKNIHVLNEIGSELSAWADKDQLEIIFRNLIGNAIKFTPREGLIKISARYAEGEILVDITDTGVGMSQAEVNNLFKMEKPSSKTGTDAERGTGIGLMITSELVQNNRGQIRVSSKEGEGSTFTLCFPVQYVHQVQHIGAS